MEAMWHEAERGRILKEEGAAGTEKDIGNGNKLEQRTAYI